MKTSLSFLIIACLYCLPILARDTNFGYQASYDDITSYRSIIKCERYCFIWPLNIQTNPYSTLNTLEPMTISRKREISTVSHKPVSTPTSIHGIGVKIKL